ncbi:MAG: hypothetical protein ACYC0X_19900 [Pirellulaceae bacterium]
MAKSPTLNRFPLFGLFANRAARSMGYTDEEARLLGYSTALLYAIFKAKAQKKEPPAKEAKKEIPKEVKALKTDTIEFGGQQYNVVRGKRKKLEKTVVGHEVHDPGDYDGGVEAKFPEGWHDRLAKAFDKYLADYDADELNTGDTLFELYRAWRDECKVGVNRVDLEQLVEWLDEHSR